MAVIFLRTRGSYDPEGARRSPVPPDRHLIGLLLGTEEDWPTAFEAIVRRMGPVTDSEGREHSYDVERLTIEPFNLRSAPRHALVTARPRGTTPSSTGSRTGTTTPASG